MDINSQTLLRILSDTKNSIGRTVNDKRAEYNLTGKKIDPNDNEEYELGYAEGIERGLHIAIQILEGFER